MKNLIASSLLAILISGNITAFAGTDIYTDKDSGFMVKARPSWMEMGGKSFYGYADKPDKNKTSLNLICAFTAKEVEEASGLEKFTTSEFMKKYKDLQVLERNGISPEKVNYSVFMPDPYEIKEKNLLSLIPKEFLDNSTVSISTNKKGKTPFVHLHILDKGTDETLEKAHRLIDMQVSITSANDMLYTVVSTFPLPDLNAQKDKIEEATPFTRQKVRKELAADNKTKIKEYIVSRQSFLKGLSFFVPEKETMPYGFDDNLLGGRIKLPENWIYAQVQDDTAKNKTPVTVTVAMPWTEPVGSLLNQGDDLPTMDTENIRKLNFQKIKEAAVFASSKTKDKKTFSELFKSPFLTQMLIDQFIKEGTEHPSVKEILEIKELNTSTDFGQNYGTVKIDGNGTIKDNYDFTMRAKIMFTQQLFGLASYITKDNEIKNAELENSIDRIHLVGDKK